MHTQKSHFQEDEAKHGLKRLQPSTPGPEKEIVQQVECLACMLPVSLIPGGNQMLLTVLCQD